MSLVTGKYMVFYSDDYFFGIPDNIIQEIVTDYLIEKIPWPSTWAYGILYYEQQIIPVVHLGNGPQRIAVICHYGNHSVAYLASGIGETIDVTENDILEGECDSNNRQRIHDHIYLYSDALWDES